MINIVWHKDTVLFGRTKKNKDTGDILIDIACSKKNLPTILGHEISHVQCGHTNVNVYARKHELDLEIEAWRYLIAHMPKVNKRVISVGLRSHVADYYMQPDKVKSVNNFLGALT